MIEAAGITLREAIEAILVIIIMATYVERTGESFKKKYIYRGAGIAVIVSVMLAVALSSIGINPENEIVEGILFFIAAVLVAGLVIWMWRHARHIKKEIESKMARASSGIALGFIAFLMVIREGVETVIFLQSLLLAGSSPVENFLGGLFGVTLAVIFGTVFMKGSSKINLSLFFKVTSVILAILVVKLLANGFHEFFEVGLLPVSPEVMLVVGTLAKSSTGALIIALMLAFLILMIIYDVFTTPRPDLSALKPAERRKQRYEFAKERYSKISLGAAMMILVLVVLTPTILASGIHIPEPVAVQTRDGKIEIPVPQTDGLYKYTYGEVRFLMAVKNGQPHVALDGCYICPPKGYGFNGEVLICINCDAPIEIGTVGSPGGCNPYVVDYEYHGGMVVLKAKTLLQTWEEMK